MQSVLQQVKSLATEAPILYALLTVGVTAVSAFILGYLMDRLGRAMGLDTSRRRYTQDRVT